ncbi:hypothetical protein FIA58_003450 [Flavobacterium jejuense]|uniref:Alpha/beta hydrolase n=1 Tax=Flavobacterium jejuense TaxID=1544455 RepID=A0ABX0ILP0_9FLAO|nr:hypothetical protein [Flavobacterium jejuense]NHN24722.1 hypothetical protein [Flavobacterium jejuense]
MKTNLKIATLLLLTTILLSWNSKPYKQYNKKHIFYIHGRIIEIQGKNAVSEEFGKYEFDSIIEAIKVDNSTVHAEIRNENVDAKKYAIKISKKIDNLVKNGVQPINITVIGASKGAIIASNISDINTNAINYVLLAGNNDYQEANNDWKFHGQVLCIYDLSDEIAGKNYNHWKNKKNNTTKFEQLELKTNLGHGFLYKPLKNWTEPTKKWIKTQTL